MMGDHRKGYGAYMSRKDTLSKTATGKSRPIDTPARSADPKVSLGGDVGVEKKNRCLWNAEYSERDILIRHLSVCKSRHEIQL
jgi:hypothetical protein